MTDKHQSEDEQIDAALAALDPAPSLARARPDLAADPSQALGARPAPPPVASPTLDSLGASRRPQAGTVCEHCPNSVWFASPVELKCYCRVMYLVTWSSKEPNQITHCDGEFLGQD